MSPHRRNIGASRRRRRDEEGEDESSINDELEDDSLSEGSVITHQEDDDADGEGTEESEDDDVSSKSPQANKINGHQANGRAPRTSRQHDPHNSDSPEKPSMDSTVSDTEAMMNGMKVSDQASGIAETHFDDLKEESDPQTGRTPSAPPTDPSKETFAERKRREHEKYVKERDTNPAFVPTRGSFFLHDKRSSDTGSNGYRPFNKSKSRPYGLIVDGNVRKQPPRQDASEGPWTHDLHDTVAGDDLPSSRADAISTVIPNPSKVPTAPRSSPPNRSFSSTVLIGNVPVRVFLPGMPHPIPFSTVPKKQYTRLPQHRPPLRRDKPVRISLPDQPPRYIFPSTERSFIFIPRALRPNQQAFRGRGRGGLYAGRRPSFYNAYTPSITMSRRSSLGRAGSQEGYPSPGGPVLQRPTMVTTDNGKPIVRLPPPPTPVGVIPPAGVGHTASMSGMPPPLLPQPQNATYHESRRAPIPMHQPRPQKAVSVADIETPAGVSFNLTQPQQEQPFHHQVPAYGNDNSGQPIQAAHPSMTPLSHIPERAIHAQPFQPYSVQPPQGYPPGYPPGSAYYPVSGPEFTAYNGAMGPASVPTFPAGQQPPYMMSAPHMSTEQPSQPGTVAHEAGGTVYYYDTSQIYPSTSFPVPPPGPGGMVGTGGMMTPPDTTYYYPQPPGGVYYGS